MHEISISRLLLSRRLPRLVSTSPFSLHRLSSRLLNLGFPAVIQSLQKPHRDCSNRPDYAQLFQCQSHISSWICSFRPHIEPTSCNPLIRLTNELFACHQVPLDESEDADGFYNNGRDAVGIHGLNIRSILSQFLSWPISITFSTSRRWPRPTSDYCCYIFWRV